MVCGALEQEVYCDFCWPQWYRAHKSPSKKRKTCTFARSGLQDRSALWRVHKVPQCVQPTLVSFLLPVTDLEARRFKKKKKYLQKWSFSRAHLLFSYSYSFRRSIICPLLSCFQHFCATVMQEAIPKSQIQQKNSFYHNNWVCNE